MKKISLLIILFIAAFQLKAQQLFKFTPSDSASSLFQNYLKINPKNVAPLFSGSGFNLKQNTAQQFSGSDFFGNNLNYTSMPVVRLEGYDSMPIVKLNSDDRMPILNLGSVGQEFEPLKALPGMPTFSSPTERN
jgi:hypothetical protein